jgi:extracellular matrix regulatory protein A
MSPPLIHLGHGNYVVSQSIHRMFPIISSQPLVTRRIRNEAKQEGRLINCSQGKAAKTVIVLKSGHIILTSKDHASIKRALTDGAPSEF